MGVRLSESEIAATQTEFKKKIINLRNFLDFRAAAVPTPYYFPVKSPDDEVGEDDYPPQFYYFCNLIGIPRQIEIFKYQFALHASEQLREFVAEIDEKSLLKSAFLFRYFLEFSAAFLARGSQMQKGCEELLEKLGVKPSPFDQNTISNIGATTIQILELTYPSRIDWDKAMNAPNIDDPVKAEKLPANILKHLKYLDQQIPSLENLYDVCSELIHPNAMPAMLAQDPMGLTSKNGGVRMALQRFSFEDIDKSEVIFDQFFTSHVSLRGIHFLHEFEPVLVDRMNKLNDLEKKMKGVLRPLGRAYLNETLNPLKFKYFEPHLACPCGDEKTFKKCCGLYRKPRRT